MKKFQRRHQSGFTLIELVVVVVLIGIVSAVAISKFINFKGDAIQAATKGVAGGLATASSLNASANKLSGVTLVTACSDVPALLTTALASNFAVDTTAGATAISTLDATSSTDANAVTTAKANSAALSGTALSNAIDTATATAATSAAALATAKAACKVTNSDGGTAVAWNLSS